MATLRRRKEQLVLNGPQLNLHDLVVTAEALVEGDASWSGRQLGHGEGYVYPHSDPAGFDVELPPGRLKGATNCEPLGNGEELGSDPEGSDPSS
jgi:hypothetical protein